MTTEGFSAQDGDAWFARNKAALETAVEHDWPLKLIEQHELLRHETKVIEFGCANGWRLKALSAKQDGLHLLGIDLSGDAIAMARESFSCGGNWRSYGFWQQAISTIPFAKSYTKAAFNLGICYFVLHWIERVELLQSIAVIDAAIQPGGHLIIGDFFPDTPTKNPYHHREGVWTYKADYITPFTATGLFREVDRIVFDHDGLDHKVAAAGWYIPTERRAVCSLLQKVAP